MNPIDDILKQAIDNLQKHNELEAAKATIARLEHKVKALREAGDDLWYCLRHRNEDPADAIEEWTEVRNG